MASVELVQDEVQDEAAERRHEVLAPPDEVLAPPDAAEPLASTSHHCYVPARSYCRGCDARSPAVS